MIYTRNSKKKVQTNNREENKEKRERKRKVVKRLSLLMLSMKAQDESIDEDECRQK